MLKFSARAEDGSSVLSILVARASATVCDQSGYVLTSDFTITDSLGSIKVFLNTLTANANNPIQTSLESAVRLFFLWVPDNELLLHQLRRQTVVAQN